MNDVITVAQSTFSRVARLKSLYLILIICILDVAAMTRYGEISLGLEKELTVDAAQALLLVIALITSMIAAFEIPRELRDKSATYILSKPGGRSSFIWGKFFGIASLVIFNVAIVAVGSLVAYSMVFDTTPVMLSYSAALIAAEGVALVGIGLLLSVFLSDTISAVVLFLVFVLGHCVTMIPRAKPNLEVLGYILPNFYHLDVKTEVSHGITIEPAYMGLGILYGLALALAMTALANIIFHKKDLQ
ncbi:MAG: ABC transporter permease subunit [Planctomycetes bacterium]|nr:ABC transporter permease subunit [Planctomycetota bacterium]